MGNPAQRGAPARVCCAVVMAVAPAVSGAIQFADVTANSGIDFAHDNGLSGDWHYPEIVGGGCGFVDYDADGRLDIVLIQSGAVPRKAADVDPPPRESSQLYRNVSENGRIRFENATEASGITTRGYGMGLATGDLTGNGHPDLYITNYGPNTLWRNNGDGTFTDISESSGTDDPGFGASASVADLDGDGRLDLFVTNYVHYDPETNPVCLAESTRRDYCGPAVFEAAGDTIFRNLGEGRFEDATDSWLGEHHALRGLGVVVADFDADGRPDVFVANDGDRNQFWRNEGGRFTEQALTSGTAVNRHGQMEAGMGIGLADVEDDGDWDLLLTHLTGESNTLYRNFGDGSFVDDTAAWRLQATTLPFTGFGATLSDFDRDGRADLFVANGAVRVIESQREDGSAYPLAQRDLIFRNAAGEHFEPVTNNDAVLAPAVGRGLATGDIDDDGRLDVLVCNNNAAPRLLHNRSEASGGWIGIQALATEAKRNALGAVVALEDEASLRQRQRVATDGSYLSARDSRVIFALPGDRLEATVIVEWPGGSVERFRSLEPGRYHRIRQGRGEVVAP